LSVEKDQITEESHYNLREPDSEDEEEYTGNEGMPAASRYHDSVVLLVPKKNFCEVFLPHIHHLFSFYSLPIQEAMEFVLSDLLLHSDSTTTRKQAKDALVWALQMMSTDIASQCLDPSKFEEVMKTVLKLCDILNEPEQSVEAIKIIFMSTTTPAYDLIKIALEKLAPALDEATAKNNSNTFWDIQ
jgi:hypothetical protein